MLSSEQISFFKANGYLILPGVMDLELCARVRDAMWQSLPKDSPMRQDVPATHVGPFAQAQQSEDSLHTRMGYRWLNRHLGVTEDVVNLIYSDTICAIAQQLLGGTLRHLVEYLKIAQCDRSGLCPDLFPKPPKTRRRCSKSSGRP